MHDHRGAPSRCLVWALFAIVWARVGAAQPAPETPARDPDERILADAGYETDTPALIAVLDALRPSEELRARIARAAARLGDPSYEAREEASRELVRIGVAARADLEALTGHADLEVRYRVQALLQVYARGTTHSYLVSAARLLGKRGATAAFDALLTATRHAPSPRVATAAEQALARIVAPEHRPALVALIERGESAERGLALRLVGRLGGDTAALVRALGEADPRLRLSAAEGLAHAGEAACLGALVSLLGEEALDVRIRAHEILKRVSGVEHAFVAYEAPEKRAAAVGRWRAWLEGPGREHKIATPLGELGRQFQGQIAYCQINPGRVVLVDVTGGELAADESVPTPWGIAFDAGGGRWVSDYARRKIVQFDSAGKKVRELDGLVPQGAMDLAVLPSGTLLVACSNANQIVELDPAKGEVSKIDVQGRPMSLEVLDDGALLVALQRTGEVVEIDRSGKRRWVKAGLKNPMSAHRLENGNTLVCEMGGQRVVEIDPAGREVWTAKITMPYDCLRLPNGNTLVGHQQGLVELDAAGTTVRTIVTGRFVVRVAGR